MSGRRTLRGLETLRSVISFRKFQLDSVARNLSRAASIGDLRRLARRRLPAGVFDYFDGGAEDEHTMSWNASAFSSYEFVPRVLRDIDEIELSLELFERPLSVPLVLAPTALNRIAWPSGELAVARAAARAGLVYTLSTLSTRSIEEVAEVRGGRNWFQVYLWRDRGLVSELLERAGEAGFEAIVLTVDSPVLGKRERDVRRGFTLPPKVGLDTILDGVMHPAWAYEFIRSEPIGFANVKGRSDKDGTTAVGLSDYVSQQFDPTLSWNDVAWIRERWRGPLLLKGIQCVDDAVLAARAGADGVVLSNHGGRQLDGSPATLELVQPAVEALSGTIPVLVDGGVRRGSDIVKALALGASAVLIGRAYLYGLGAGGERGVDHALQLLQSEMQRTMALIGCRRVEELTPSVLRKRR